MKILICGFMGCGKSTLLLEAKKEFPDLKCLDLDEEILAAYNQGHEQKFDKLGPLIENLGWEKFRQLEREGLKRLLKLDSYIIALGGGSLKEETISLFENDALTLIHLNPGFEACYQRIKDDKNRPLVKKSKEELKELFNHRLQYYQKADIDVTEIPGDLKSWLLALNKS